MPKTFFCCLSLKTGAWVMTGTNLLYGLSSVFSSGIALTDKQDDEDRLNLIISLIMGIYNLVVGGVMLRAIFKGSERLVLLYVLLEMVNLFIISVFSTINIFEYKSLTRSISLTGLTVACILCWYGLYCMWSFYNELEEYNRTSVKSGVIEIAANENCTGLEPVMFLENKTIESVAV